MISLKGPCAPFFFFYLQSFHFLSLIDSRKGSVISQIFQNPRLPVWAHYLLTDAQKKRHKGMVTFILLFFSADYLFLLLK